MDHLVGLRKSLVSRGLYAKATIRIIGELACHVCITIVGLILIFSCETPSGDLIGMLLAAIGSFGVATNTHTSSHYATSEIRWVNEALTYFGAPFFWQVSATYWYHKHLILHHANPNTIGIDTDIDLLPWFTLIRGMRHRSRLLSLYYRHQLLFFPFALAFNAYKFQIAGWRFLLSSLRRPTRRSRQWIDLVAMVLHLVCWIIIPATFIPLTSVLLFYNLRNIFMGYAMFCVFAPAHFPQEAVLLDKATAGSDFVLRQTSATLNFRMGPLSTFICSGLNYQIEHHLFPGISHVYYAGTSKLVQQFCAEHGYPYRTLEWGEAILKSFHTMQKLKPVVGLPAVKVTARS